MILKERKTLIKRRKSEKSFSFRNILFFFLMIFIFASLKAQAFAHDGHDHGDESKKEVVVSNKNELVRSVRVDEYEVTVKHALLTPDKETSFRLFLTQFDTNTPVEKAKVSLEIKSSDGVSQEISLTESKTAGMYEGNFPPLSEGEIKLSVKGSVGGSTLNGNLGSIQITKQVIENPSSSSLWAKRLLIALGIVAAVLIISAIAFLIYKNARRTKIEKEAIA